MIDYERFLESFDIVDTESGDADAVLATMRARAVPSRRDRGGGGSPPLCRPAVRSRKVLHTDRCG